jgi:uncharacterized protein (DUF58 family)
VLTRRGLAAVLGVLGLAGLGRFFGVLELYLLAAVLGVLVVVALARTWLVRLELGVARSARPSRVHAGTPARVELEITNRGNRPAPVLRLLDPVSGTRGADVGVGPLGPGERAHAAYRLPTDRRGVLDIGPLTIEVTDPFGLTRLRLAGAGRTSLTVYPPIEHLVGPGETSGYDPESALELPSSLGRSGEEFYALRPYVVGDELRRVHWPSSARYDELLVRQQELPWQGRATVVLDVRADAHTDESLDLAVSAAASILAAARRSGDLVRLVSTDGTDSGWALGNQGFTAILEYLAVVDRNRTAALPRALERLGRSTDGGALVAVGARWSPADRTRLAGVRRRFRQVTSVVVDRSAWDPDAPPGPPDDPDAAPRADEIVIAADRPLAEGWRRSVTRAGHRPHRTGMLR